MGAAVSRGLVDGGLRIGRATSRSSARKTDRATVLRLPDNFPGRAAAMTTTPHHRTVGLAAARAKSVVRHPCPHEEQQ
ncbi:hypothetical protein C4J65_30170 [Streptomyces sp. CB09001]|uniref:hypothetical protein n=1 Tax=unclassified Streptomyces TaxID=2593676 RepID=UPI000E213929|nr:hypothetical protein [Streptomyces sp. CB09001]AXL92084.1 hypothetical protein C4J65_30170 [Streptomyces sp. CB09001]